jgi:hypothetical protein
MEAAATCEQQTVVLVQDGREAEQAVVGGVRVSRSNRLDRGRGGRWSRFSKVAAPGKGG